ncbi:MAG: hypothetical protein QXD23_01650 [Candidatus Micrarchaeaceae archaeon]
MIKIYKKSESRYITENYGEKKNIVKIYERINDGVLVTEILKNEGVFSQSYLKNSNIPDILFNEYKNEFFIEEKDLEKTFLDKKCTFCSGKLYRELEFLDPWNIKNIPVVPIFRCNSCGKKFYSLTDKYLEKLVSENKDMFEKEDLQEFNENKEKFINTLNAYIIRIFASQKINRI